MADVFYEDSSIIVQALTAAQADNKCNLERLEFYGDSVFNFLVILEKFLTEDHKLNESQLDLERIKCVSNMSFENVNKITALNKFMITEKAAKENPLSPIEDSQILTSKSINET